jgi:hypothetical protein
MRQASTDVVRGSLLPWVRAGVGVLLVLAVADGVFLYVLSSRADTDYAWPIKPRRPRLSWGPVTSRARWRPDSSPSRQPAAMIATAQLWCAADLRRRHEAFVPYTALAVWCVALLAIPALHHDELTRTGTPLVGYLVGFGALLALAGYGIVLADRSAL